MTVRLTLLAHAPTEATRRHRFPLDEPADDVTLPLLDAQATVLTSAARRCRQAAEALGAAATVEARLDDWDLGAWGGRAPTELDPAELQVWLSDPDAAPHGGESLAGLMIRVGGLLTELAGADGVLVACTHPAVLRAATVHALDAPLTAFWRVDVEPLARLSMTATGARWNLRLTTPESQPPIRPPTRHL
jgi:broad specificity phosphatase PhoE